MTKLEKFLYYLLYSELTLLEIEASIEDCEWAQIPENLKDYIGELASRLQDAVEPESIPIPEPIPEPAPEPVPNIKKFNIGINLNQVTYYSPAWVFVDLMKTARVKDSINIWDGTTGITYGKEGYPISVAVGQKVWTLLAVAIGSHYPSGAYTLQFEGDGDVSVRFAATPATFTHNGIGKFETKVNVAAANSGIEVAIRRSSLTNPVRNIRFIMPGFESTPDVFHPSFLEMIGPFNTLRFMDWGKTNNSTVTEWINRSNINFFTYAKGLGVPYERMIELCNWTDKNMWICVPHGANNEYIRNLAELIKEQLEPNLKVYIEYSNEVWNSIFSQYDYVRENAANNNLDWSAWYAHRAVEIFRIFKDVFGGTERLVRVLGVQNANPYIADKIMTAAGAGNADCLAIAPYIGGKLGTASMAETVKGWTVDQILNYCMEDIDIQATLVAQHKSNAAKHNMTVIGYEGGQHLVGVGTYQSDTVLISLFHAANRDIRMGDVYKRYLEVMSEYLETFCLYNDCFVPGKSGSWGLMEYQDEVGPKYSAVKNYIEEIKI